MSKKRRHYAIDKLPVDVKETVNEMVKADFTYREIVDYIRLSGNKVSLSAVQRYASHLMQSVKTLRIAQENFSAIMQETDKYDNVDFTEPLIRLLCSQLLAQIGNLSDEQMQELSPNDLIKQTISLTRAVAYKKNIDFSNKSLFERASKEFDNALFSAIYSEKPELYTALKDFINSKIQD